MYTLSDDKYITAFSAEAAPALMVPDGATVAVKTQDCYMNNLRAENDPRGEAKGPAIGCNPATGPIFVEGAMPGDTLACDILSIEVGEYASMRISSRGGFMRERVTEPIVRCVPLKDGFAELAGVKMPLDPMIGVIGVAPESGAVDTETPGAHGGNMDARLIRAGTTVYLPVRHPGALLALGDVHAKMGDGELCICGLECPAVVTLRLRVIHGRQEAWPVLRGEDGSFSVLASGEDLDEASRFAADAMLDFLKRRTAIDVNELILLMSLVCHLEVCQVVDPLITARVRLEGGAMAGVEF
ncbi:MAG: acetamidase/formamidase family protein [Clostridia bacterium]|nr:acetamidase/formamidase family protein [Clostridia bacterium]